MHVNGARRGRHRTVRLRTDSFEQLAYFDSRQRFAVPSLGSRKSRHEKVMNTFSLEQSRLAFQVDFAFYSVASTTLFTVLLACPQGRRVESAALAVAGLAGCATPTAAARP